MHCILKHSPFCKVYWISRKRSKKKKINVLRLFKSSTCSIHLQNLSYSLKSHQNDWLCSPPPTSSVPFRQQTFVVIYSAAATVYKLLWSKVWQKRKSPEDAVVRAFFLLYTVIYLFFGWQIDFHIDVRLKSPTVTHIEEHKTTPF